LEDLCSQGGEVVDVVLGLWCCVALSVDTSGFREYNVSILRAETLSVHKPISPLGVKTQNIKVDKFLGTQYE